MFVDFILLMTEVSVMSSLIIEAVKNLVGVEYIKKIFKSLEIFSFIITLFISTFVYVAYIIIYGMGDYTLAQIITFAIVFILFSACGSQVGYDKVIKTIKDLWVKESGEND